VLKLNYLEKKNRKEKNSVTFQLKNKETKSKLATNKSTTKIMIYDQKL